MMIPYISNHWYYVDANNEIIGPFCLSTLDAFYVEGIISLNTQVIRAFGTDFQPYSDIFTDSELRMTLL